MTMAELHASAGVSPTRLRHLVAGLGLTATAVLAVALQRAQAVPADPWVLGVAILGLAMATAIPVLIQTSVADDTAQGHVAVLVPTLVLLPWHAVVLATAGGVAAGWLLRRLPGLPGAPPAARPTDVLTSVSRATLAAGVAAAVATVPVTALPLAEGPARVALAVAGAITFLVAARVLVIATDHLSPPAAAPHTAGPRSLPPSTIRAVAVTLGLLTALVATAYPAPAVWLAVLVTVGTAIALGLSAVDTARVHHAALLRIAAHAHASMDVDAVERAVADNLTPLVRAAQVEIRDLPPGHDDIGTPLPVDGGEPTWLVATHRGRRTHGFSDRDRRLLAAAAPLVGTAVDNARRHTAVTAAAATDPLTGVANRRTFEAELSRRLRHARATDRATALVILDLDGFKAVNDELGHDAGDDVLIAVARLLRAALRRGDLVARLGGDEFAVVAALASPDEEDMLRERLEGQVAGLQASDGRAVGASLGIAVAPRDGRTTRLLYAAADERMYAVKHGSA